MNKKMIRYIVGSIIMLEAALLLLPILTAIVYGEWNTLRVFAGSALFCIVTGALLRGYAGTSSHGRTLQYASDEGREPWPICRKTGSEGQKYG